MKAVVAAFNQEKALVGAFSVITNLRIIFGWNFLRHYLSSLSLTVLRSAMLSTASWTTGPHNWLEGARVQPSDRGQGSFSNLSPR